MDFKSPSLNWESTNMVNKFRKFKQTCNLVFKGPMAKSGEQLTHVLLWVGFNGMDIFNTSSVPEEEKTLERFWDLLEKAIEPRHNFRLERFNLTNMVQEEAETVDNFILRLRIQCDRCKFNDEITKKERITEQLIKGSNTHQCRTNYCSKISL